MYDKIKSCSRFSSQKHLCLARLFWNNIAAPIGPSETGLHSLFEEAALGKQMFILDYKTRDLYDIYWLVIADV